VIEVNRKILSIVLALGFVLLATPYIGIVNATPPTPVSFGFPLPSFGPGAFPPTYRQNGPNWFSHASVSSSVIGDIMGSMTSDTLWLYHDWVGPVEDPTMQQVGWATGHAVLTIDPAIVGEKIGTIILRFSVYPHEFAGTWEIIRGTGDLKGIHGQGTFELPGLVNGVPCQAFEGQIHFDP